MEKPSDDHDKLLRITPWDITLIRDLQYVTGEGQERVRRNSGSDFACAYCLAAVSSAAARFRFRFLYWPGCI
jgi:hypothetical protein